MNSESEKQKIVVVAVVVGLETFLDPGHGIGSWLGREIEEFEEVEEEEKVD